MKPNITFYQLNTSSQEDILKLICELCANFYQTKRNIYILCPELEYLYNLDEYIINYHKTSFFPYQILGEGPIPPALICLGTDTTTKLKYDILINLHSIIPDNCNKYREIIELIDKDTNSRVISREHYRHYKKLNFTVSIKDIETNTIND